MLDGLRVGAALRPAGVAEHSFWAAVAVRSASSPVIPCTAAWGLVPARRGAQPQQLAISADR